jgi:PAS domain S-box-containing protein
MSQSEQKSPTLNESIIDRLRPLTDAHPHGIVVMDAAGRIVLANPMTGTMFGYAPA